MDPARKKVKVTPKATLLWVMTLGGIMAVSGFMIWTEMKEMVHATAMPKSMTMRQSFQSYLAPPHCIANSRLIHPGRKNSMPIGSRRLTWPIKLTGGRICLGGFQKIVMKIRVTPPMGRLMKKHHRHETVVVKPPPTKGPMTEATPKTMPKIPWKAGRLCSGIMGIMMSIVPEKRPAEAKPATERPRMNMVEDWAAPQMAEPISKTTRLMMKVLLRVRIRYVAHREGKVLTTSCRRTCRFDRI